MGLYYGVDDMDFPTEVSFASDIDFTVEREVKVALQDTLSTQSLVVLTNVLNNFVLNEQTISLLKQFLLYIKTSLYMDVHISALADLLIKYQNIFVINDLCEIILVLAVKGVDFTQTNTTEFFNKLLFADEIMRVLGRDDKEDFIALFESTDAYRLNYIQRHCGKSEDDSEMLLLTTKFSVLVALLSVKGVFYPQELERLRNVLSQGYRQSKSSIRNCLVALEELASLEILGDFAEISDRTEILGLFVLYIEKHWFDPIVAKDIIAEFSRLKFINKVMDLYTLTNKRFLYIVDGMSYDIPDKPEIFGCWFGDPKLVALWKKLKPEDFNLRNLQTLLISAQVLYRSLGRFAPKAIRQDIYDELNSILLNKQYKKHRNLLKLAQDIPSDMWSLYVLNSCFDIHNTFEATLILYHLPLNIQRIFVRENDASFPPPSM